MLVMQTKHGFIIGNKYVFLNFKAQGKEVLFIQSINHSKKKVLIFQSNFFFFYPSGNDHKNGTNYFGIEAQQNAMLWWKIAFWLIITTEIIYGLKVCI